MVQQIAPIVLRIPTAANPATVRAALTVPQRVAAWFTTASPLGAVGAPNTPDCGNRSVVDGDPRELVPGHRLADSWHWVGAPASVTTLVTWAMVPTTDGRSAVALRHAGWAEAGPGEADRDDDRGTWHEYLDGLRKLLSEGA